jgi:hypothetical protein
MTRSCRRCGRCKLAHRSYRDRADWRFRTGGCRYRRPFKIIFWRHL